MLFTKYIALAVLPALALAAPVEEQDNVARGEQANTDPNEGIALLTKNVLQGPKGYVTLDDGKFHEGQYKPAAKREAEPEADADAVHAPESKRFFFSLFRYNNWYGRPRNSWLYYHHGYPGNYYCPYGNWWMDNWGGYHTGRPYGWSSCSQSGWCAPTNNWSWGW